MKRRDFISSLGAAGLLLNLKPVYGYPGTAAPLNILVLGGTDFLGPAVVGAGMAAGHRITLFNRGITNPQLFSELPLIRGDREKGRGAYAPLLSNHWDVVIDVWPQQSELVDQATSVLRSHTDHYLFVSSVSVYRDFTIPGVSESHPLTPLPDDQSKWEYPEEKVAAEKLVAERFPDAHTILRPGPIKGWRDPAKDLLYWLLKLRRGERVLAPGDGNDPLQFIDVKDVGRFAIHAAETRLHGAYNCVGPMGSDLTWREFLTRASRHLASDSQLVWSSREQLEALGARPWVHFPLWAPLSDDAFMQISAAKALAAGFNHTPLEQTLSDCLAWHSQQGFSEAELGPEGNGMGLERERELELLEQLTD